MSHMMPRDHVLPLPKPNWAKPTPLDPATPPPESIDVIAALRAMADAIPTWLTVAVTNGTTSQDWQSLADQLNDVACQCRVAAGAADRPVIDMVGPEGR